jgi:hypothetical protein
MPGLAVILQVNPWFAFMTQAKPPAVQAMCRRHGGGVEALRRGHGEPESHARDNQSGPGAQPGGKGDQGGAQAS